MKKDGLLSLLTASEKRKDVLFLLHEKPRTLQDIKDHFDVRSPEILPRLKEMEAAKMIIKQDGLYSLAPLGRVAAMYYKPLLDTLDAIESNESFWGEHDLSAISAELLYRIRELKECSVIRAESYNICESHPEFKENVSNSLYFKGAACIFIPSWIDLFLELANRGASIEIILTDGVYNKIKCEYASELDILLKHGTHFYIYNDLKTSFAVTDEFLSLSLNYFNGVHDTKNDMQGSDPASIKWGESLFSWYKAQAVEMVSTPPLYMSIIQKMYPQSLLI
ncbi:MAG: winged helix-turn-helix domain-containing protein [Parabacteroides sp.]|nr:winged helix-turn-helix domain-containing protein [Parabacteroides sp.]